MRRALTAILCTVIWLLVGQVSGRTCSELSAVELTAVHGCITDADCGTVCGWGGGISSLPVPYPDAVERSGGAVPVRSAFRRAGCIFTKIFVPDVADGHAGRATHTSDLDIRRSTHRAKRYVNVLRRLRI